jgi:hypothetical protein
MAKGKMYKKSYKSAKRSAKSKGLHLSKAMKSEIKTIAKMSVEQVAEKKEMGSQSIMYDILKTMTGNEQLVPPTYLGLQGYQRIGAHIRCHSLRLKVQGYIEFDPLIPKYYPNGVYIDIRVYSVKGVKSAQQVYNGNVTGALANAVAEYKYNINNIQSSGSGTVDQYGPVTGQWNDEFCKVNEEMITEHYKTSILLDTFYDGSTFPSRTQHTKSAFQKYINLAPFIAKQWKYDPDAQGGAPIQTAAQYPNNVCLFVNTSYRNPNIDNTQAPPLMGQVQYCTMGTFSDV